MAINILDKKTYSMIAAGEVVERPSSVIKELVENSIDANSTEIQITIENGGKSSMLVEDNGCGISNDDLPKAVMPHATSKISCATDLEHINTLGFRGEALASIASVSKMNIHTRDNSEPIGISMDVEGGVFSKITSRPRNQGTSIRISDLFYNTPARAKFLKKDSGEELEIRNIISRLIIAHSDISFKLVCNDKLTYQTYGGGIEEAIITIYGYDTLRQCFKIETEKNGIKLYGLIGKTSFSKPNKTYQTFILNGRYINNNTVQSAIQNAYSSYLMKRQYPFYALLCEIDPEIVDVNVHPNKTDVRFVDNQSIYGTIYSIISKVLAGSAEALEIIKDNEAIDSPYNTYDKKESYFRNNKYAVENNNDIERVKSDVFNNRNSYTTVNEFHDLTPYDEYFDGSQNKSIDDIFAENKRYILQLDKERQERESKQEKIALNERFRSVGQVLTTYLILEHAGDMYIVDQHAAHERMIFDKLLYSYKNSTSATQALLVPYCIDFSDFECEFISKNIDLFNRIGFDIRNTHDNHYIVEGVPQEISEIDLKDFFTDFLSDIPPYDENVPNLVYEKIIKRACKSAIKSGMILDQSEIDKIIDEVSKNPGMKCPHGRPVVVKITRNEIDKWFKRIV